eukprot:841286_1
MALALHVDTIMKTIERDYPNVAQLLTDKDVKNEPLGVLKAANVIRGYSMKGRDFGVNHRGNDNFITWIEYGTKIEQHLKDNPEYRMYPKLLAKAVKTLAKYFHDEHYKAYPRWPST